MRRLLRGFISIDQKGVMGDSKLKWELDYVAVDRWGLRGWRIRLCQGFQAMLKRRCWMRIQRA